jgi:predicted outer membrane repeat protein
MNSGMQTAKLTDRNLGVCPFTPEDYVNVEVSNGWRYREGKDLVWEKATGGLLMRTVIRFVFAGALMLFGLIALRVSARGATTIYVDASASAGAGTGSSWTDAYTTLQDALKKPPLSGDKIWVAAGVYYPDQGGGMTNNDRSTTFTLLNDVAVYGGFAGGEVSLSQRDWVANVTVLSGDIDQNDTADPNGVVTDVANIVGSNAYHVITGGGTNPGADLDGFTVTAGQANGTILLRSIGGGILNDNSSPSLSNVSFRGNTANDGGGGMYNYISSPIMNSVVFNGNQADFGGGMVNFQSSPMLTDVNFSGNLATSLGGGMYNTNGSNPLIANASFNGNQAGLRGGGMYNINSDPSLLNVIFTGNQASDAGGMYNFGNSGTTLTQITFTGNRATNQGGGLYAHGSTITMTNTILWNNQAAVFGHQIYNTGSSLAISYSDIQGSGGSSSWDTGLGTDGGNNIDDDPLFVTLVDPTTAPTTVGDLHLQTDSPAVDTGDNGPCLSIDLDGNKRPIDGDLNGSAVCDMGAYEKLIDLFLPLITR